MCLLIATALLGPRTGNAVTFNGELTYTSDFVYRGISETGGRPAGQIDLHVTSGDGTFLGVFGSTVERLWQRGYDTLGWHYEIQEYLGHRFDVSQSWSTTVTAVNYSYANGNVPYNNDYQELSLAASYLDSWTVTLAVIPNAVRYESGYRLGRYTAYTADAATQLPLIGRLLFAAGAGYYTSDGAAYAYGNAGLAFEFKSLRFDAGYYVAPDRAQRFFPYGRAGNRFAGSVSWHF